MSTQAQVHANQMNAQASTGPRTDAGKAASAMNGLTHGLTSDFRLLPSEDQAAFDALAAKLRSEMRPSGEHEMFLVNQMAQARWRLARIDRLEGAAFDYILNPEAPADTVDAKIVAYMAARKNSDILATLQRYAAAAERLYSKSYRELLHSRQVAQKMYHEAVRIEIDKIVKAPLQNGFASQNSSQAAQQPAPQPGSAHPAAAQNAAKKPSAAESLGNLALRL